MSHYARIVDAPSGAPQRFLPPISDAGEPFWDATRSTRLVIQWCRTCEQAIHFPREACPGCLGEDLEFRPGSEVGTVYAATMIPISANPTMAGRGPYVIVLVDLPEGVRLMSSVVGPGALEVAVGDEVRVAWEPLDDGRHLLVFVRE